MTKKRMVQAFAVLAVLGVTCLYAEKREADSISDMSGEQITEGTEETEEAEEAEEAEGSNVGTPDKKLSVERRDFLDWDSLPTGEHGGKILGDYEYDIVRDDVWEMDLLKMLAYLGDESVVFVPEEVQGKGEVLVIGEGAFQYNSSVEQVILPDSIIRIEASAFAYCPRLKYVVMGTNIEWIGAAAFSDCPSIEEIHFPEGLEVLGAEACRYCSRLEKVYLPNSIADMGYHPFKGCENLRLIYGRSEHAKGFAEELGCVYVDLNRIEEEGNIVW